MPTLSKLLLPSCLRPTSLDVELDLQACTLYRIVANYESKTGGDWKPVVYSEPLGECIKKFKK